MEKKTYIPQPVDTTDVELPAELDELIDAIAKNVHDVWAQGRIAEGWRYGKSRNDILKETPCLLPYEDLPESEKEYDKATALGTLKLIKKLGFDIVKRS